MSYVGMAPADRKHALRIGYIWQYDTEELFSTLSTWSASSLHAKAVIREFEKRGHQVRMITLRQGRPHWSDDLISWHPIKPSPQPRAFRLFERVVRGLQSRLHIPYLNLFDSHRFAAACVAAAANCDVFYERFWMMASGALIASKRLGIPIIYEVNGDLVEEYRQQGLSLSKAQWAAIHTMNKIMFEKAGCVVAVSQALKETIVRRLRLRNSNITAIENGADVSLFANPNQHEVDAVRSRYQLNDSLAVIFVGSFKPWHGIDILVNAFGQLAASHPKARLVLVGDGPLRSEIEAWVAALHLEHQVIFTGWVCHREVPALMNAADIAVLNPKVSGASAAQSPLKLFEYMAAGNAIVAPKISNVRRILTDRKSGLLVPPDNPEALRDALAELLEDNRLRLRLGQAARQQAIEKHSWDRAVSELESILYDLLEEPQ